MREKFGENIETKKRAEEISLIDFLERNELLKEKREEKVEEILEKVKDLKSGEGVLTHKSLIDNLESILQKGIWSQEFTKRANQKIKELPIGLGEIGREQYGMNKIFFYDGDRYMEWQLKKYQGKCYEGLSDSSTGTREEISEEMKTKYLKKHNFLNIGFPAKSNPLIILIIGPRPIPPPFDFFAIVIDKAKLPSSHNIENLGPWSSEVLLKPRVAPRFFSGIIVHSESKVKVESAKLVFDFAKNYKIPIYNEKGDIIWPKAIKYDELKEWLEERKINNQVE